MICPAKLKNRQNLPFINGLNDAQALSNLMHNNLHRIKMTDIAKVDCSDESHLFLVIDLNRLENVDSMILLLSPERIGGRDFPETCVLVSKNVETMRRNIQIPGPQEYGLVYPNSVLEIRINFLCGERNNRVAHF